jgi:hypothetical protein
MSANVQPTGPQPPSDPTDGQRVRHHSAKPPSKRGRHILLALAIGAATVAVPPLIAPGQHREPGTPEATPRPGVAVPSAPKSDPGDLGTPAPTLLSRGRPVTASSTEYALTPAAAAVDGKPGTRWSSAFADPQWLRVDLGAVSTITRIVLYWDPSHATAYEIQTSTDDTTWTSIYSTTTSSEGTQTLTVTGRGRYVRMYGTARSTRYGYSLWEFEVYGISGLTGCDTGGNAALNRPARASSVERGLFPATNAVDGQLATRWSSEASDPQWIQVDLESSQHICRVDLAWETAYATAYQIQISTEGTTWTTVYNTTTSEGGTETLAVTGTGRYVRVYGTARASAWGYSLLELAVHTGVASATGET